LARQGILDSNGRVRIKELKAPSVVLIKLSPH
jgi:hypothetical protein